MRVSLFLRSVLPALLLAGFLARPIRLQERPTAEIERQDLQGRLRDIEERLRNPKGVPLEELRECRRKLEKLELQGIKVDATFLASVGQARNTFERVYAERLREDARSFAAENPDKRREALDRYAKAEDEIYSLIERAFLSSGMPVQKDVEKPYREVQAESDALCATVFTPEVIARTPWRDLLAPDMVKEWIASSVKGLSWRIERGTLRIEGPAKETEMKGILSIGDREKWRDFVLDFEVTFESGEIELFVRLGPHADRRAVSVNLGVSPDGFTLGAPYNCELCCIGDRLTLKLGDREPWEEVISWTTSRKGSVGVVIPPETKVKFTRMRIRVLR